MSFLVRMVRCALISKLIYLSYFSAMWRSYVYTCTRPCTHTLKCVYVHYEGGYHAGIKIENLPKYELLTILKATKFTTVKLETYKSFTKDMYGFYKCMSFIYGRTLVFQLYLFPNYIFKRYKNL